MTDKARLCHRPHLGTRWVWYAFWRRSSAVGWCSPWILLHWQLDRLHLEFFLLELTSGEPSFMVRGAPAESGTSSQPTFHASSVLILLPHEGELEHQPPFVWMKVKLRLQPLLLLTGHSNDDWYPTEQRGEPAASTFLIRSGFTPRSLFSHFTLVPLGSPSRSWL